MGKICVSTTIDAGLYERIHKERWKLNDLIESAVHYKDMDIRDAKELKDRLERLTNLVDRLQRKIWDIEGKMLSGGENVLGNKE
jgi:hypothetical protein